MPQWTEPLDLLVRGLKFRCYYSDNTPEYKLAFQGRRLDRWHLNVLAPFFHSEGVFVDVGANFGFFSLNAARAMGQRGRVVSIEPNPDMLKRLRQNILLNGIDTITVYGCAVGETRGFAIPRAIERNYGGSRYDYAPEALSGAETEEMRPLLDIVVDTGLERIDALKIDVEGYEDRVLGPFFSNSARKLWPGAIMIEDAHKESWVVDIIGRLGELGYRPIARRRDDVLLRLSG